MRKVLQVRRGWDSSRRGRWQEITQLRRYQFSVSWKKKSQCCCHLCFSHDNKLQVTLAQRFKCCLALFPFFGCDYLPWQWSPRLKSCDYLNLQLAHCESHCFGDIVAAVDRKALQKFLILYSFLLWTHLSEPVAGFQFLRWLLRCFSLGTL